MYARLVIGSVVPLKVNEAIDLWSQNVLPYVKMQKGFKGVRLMADRSSGKIVSVGLWESEKDFQATVDWNERQVARFTDLFTSTPQVGGYEVIFDVQAGEV